MRIGGQFFRLTIVVAAFFSSMPAVVHWVIRTKTWAAVFVPVIT